MSMRHVPDLSIETLTTTSALCNEHRDEGVRYGSPSPNVNNLNKPYNINGDNESELEHMAYRGLQHDPFQNKTNIHENGKQT